MRRNAYSAVLLTLLVAMALAGAGCACSRVVSESQSPPGATSSAAPSAVSAPALRCGHEMLNAVLWAQTAVEWEFACRQSFVLARTRLDEGLADTNWTAAIEQTSGYQNLPPAVIVDVDETMLDNSPCEARFIVVNTGFDPKAWGAWVNEARAEEIPGAREFVQYALARGVRVFFVTNRDSSNQPATVSNLGAVFGQAVSPEDVLCENEKPGWTSDKSSRRVYLAATYRILLLIGDDFGDFASLGKIGSKERRTAGEQYSSYWGTRWVILPNAMYGSWERALNGYDSKLPDSIQLNRKYDALRTEE